MPVSIATPPMQTEILGLLERLVAFDTRNPPRRIDGDGIIRYCASQLEGAGFAVRIDDHGAGSVGLFAVRGEPRVLINCHLDTVPDAPGWKADPLTLRIAGTRAIGLGACDIKGAAAALLAAAQATQGPAAILFTTDEEANDARAVPAFLSDCEPKAFDFVVVAEPTGGLAVSAHRGIASLLATAQGLAGHASLERARGDSAVHRLVRWSASLLHAVEAQDDQAFAELRGLRCNIGRIDGGIKGNMIASEATAAVSLRPLPSTDLGGLLESVAAQLPAAARPQVVQTFHGPALPAAVVGGDVNERKNAARRKAERYELEPGAAVDFWTEAALFSAAGFDAVVCGPGDIAQAHAADEWVAIDELLAYGRWCERLFGGAVAKLEAQL